MEKVATYLRRIAVALALATSAACSDGPGSAPPPTPENAGGSSKYALKVYLKEGDETKPLKIVPSSHSAVTSGTVPTPSRSPSSRRTLDVSPEGPSKQALDVTECHPGEDGGKQCRDPVANGTFDSNPTVLPSTALLRFAYEACTRLRDRQEDGVPNYSEPWAEVNFTPEITSQAWYIFAARGFYRDTSAGFYQANQMYSCDQTLWMQESLLCIADRLAEIGDAVTTLNWNLGGQSEIIIPTQAAEDKFIARELALNALAHVPLLDETRPLWYGAGIWMESCSSGYAAVAGDRPLPNGAGEYNLISDSAYPGDLMARLDAGLDYSDFSIRAGRRLKYRAHLLRAAARLAQSLVEKSAAADLAGAQQQRSRAADPARGAKLMWGQEDDRYNNLEHGLKTVFGRLELRSPNGAAPVPFVDDPECRGHGSWSLMDTLSPGFSARWNDRPEVTQGQSLALSLVSRSGTVLPPGSGTAAPPYGYDGAAPLLLRELLEAALIHRIALTQDQDGTLTSQEFAKFKSSTIAEATRAVVAQLQDQDIHFAFERTWDAFRLLMDDVPPNPSGSIGAFISPILATSSTDKSYLVDVDTRITTDLKGVVLRNGLPREDLSIDSMGTLSGAHISSQCGIDGLDIWNEVKSSRRAFQNGFELGRVLKARLDLLAREMNTIGAGAPTEVLAAKTEVRDLADAAAVEIGSWAGKATITYAPGLELGPSDCPGPSVLGLHGYCSKQCPCGQGMGSCRSDEDCQGTLVCVVGNGEKFGMSPDAGICADPSCRDYTRFEGQADYCAHCPCGLDMGGCANDDQCSAAGQGGSLECVGGRCADPGGHFILLENRVVRLSDAGVISVKGLRPADYGLKTMQELREHLQLVTVSGADYDAWRADCVAGQRKACSALAKQGTQVIGINNSSSKIVNGDEILIKGLALANASKIYLVITTSADPNGAGRVLATIGSVPKGHIATTTISESQRGLANQMFGFTNTVRRNQTCSGLGATSLPPSYCVPGIERDMFVPLSNELTSDSAASGTVEDSWKHYLSLAKQAATDADELGRQLIEAGKEKLRAENEQAYFEFNKSVLLAQRAEAAQEKLSELCGAFVDAESIREAIGAAKTSDDWEGAFTSDDKIQSCIHPELYDVVFTGDDPTDAIPKEQVQRTLRGLFCCKGLQGVGVAGSAFDKCQNGESTAPGAPSFCSAIAPIKSAGLRNPSAIFPPPFEGCPDESAVIKGLGSTPARFEQSSFRSALRKPYVSATMLGALLARLRYFRNTNDKWGLTLDGDPLMGSSGAIPGQDERLLYPACLASAGGCSCENSPQLKGTEKCQRVIEVRTMLGWGNPDQQGVASRVEMALWHMGALAGEIPSKVFALPFPAVNFSDSPAYPPNAWTPTLFGNGRWELNTFLGGWVLKSSLPVQTSDDQAFSMLWPNQPVDHAFAALMSAPRPERKQWVSQFYQDIDAQIQNKPAGTTPYVAHVWYNTPIEFDTRIPRIDTHADPIDRSKLYQWLVDFGTLTKPCAEEDERKAIWALSSYLPGRPTNSSRQDLMNTAGQREICGAADKQQSAVFHEDLRGNDQGYQNQLVPRVHFQGRETSGTLIHDNPQLNGGCSPSRDAISAGYCDDRAGALYSSASLAPQTYCTATPSFDEAPLVGAYRPVHEWFDVSRVSAKLTPKLTFDRAVSDAPVRVGVSPFARDPGADLNYDIAGSTPGALPSPLPAEPCAYDHGRIPRDCARFTEGANLAIIHSTPNTPDPAPCAYGNQAVVRYDHNDFWVDVAPDRLRPTQCSPSPRVELFVDRGGFDSCSARRAVPLAMGLACLASHALPIDPLQPPPPVDTLTSLKRLEQWTATATYNISQALGALPFFGLSKEAVDGYLHLQSSELNSSALGKHSEYVNNVREQLFELKDSWDAALTGLDLIRQSLTRARIDLEANNVAFSKELTGLDIQMIEAQRREALAGIDTGGGLFDQILGVASVGLEAYASGGLALLATPQLAQFTGANSVGDKTRSSFAAATTAASMFGAARTLIGGIGTNSARDQANAIEEKAARATESEIETLRQLAAAQKSLADQGVFANLNKTTTGEARDVRGAFTQVKLHILEIDKNMGLLKTNAILAQAQLAKMAGKDFFTLVGSEPDFDALNQVLARQYDVVQARYERALERGKRAAYLARLAIEQRLGVRLADLNAPVGPLAPPSTWADDVCNMQGINYSALEADPGPGQDRAFAQSFANRYIGEYVNQLSEFMEFYNIARPFHESEDIAVLSLRDDLAQPDVECIVESRNELYHSDALYATRTLDENHRSLQGWTTAPCGQQDCLRVRSGDLLATTAPSSDAGARDPIAGGDNAVFPPPGGIGGVSWLKREPPGPLDSGDDVFHGPTTASVYQTIPLRGGTDYILSWWDMARAADGAVPSMGASLPEYSALVFDSTWALVATDRMAAAYPGAGGTGWSPRRQLVFTPFADGDYHIAFAVETAGGSLAIANVQVERSDGANAGAYERTEDRRTRRSPDCSKQVSMRDMFVRRCEGGADGSGTAETCFWALKNQFVLDTESLNQGFGPLIGKVAQGNFNYRHVDTSLNVVGTGVLDCTGQPTNSCYSSGYVEYDLGHAAFNAPIQDYNNETHCFDFGAGRIRSGKALATERLITLPIGQADRGLLEQPAFQKRELAGRPLSGLYSLRIKDSPALVWDQITDIQLVMRYRYWSRIDRAQ